MRLGPVCFTYSDTSSQFLFEEAEIPYSKIKFRMLKFQRPRGTYPIYKNFYHRVVSQENKETERISERMNFISTYSQLTQA